MSCTGLVLTSRRTASGWSASPSVLECLTRSSDAVERCWRQSSARPRRRGRRRLSGLVCSLPGSSGRARTNLPTRSSTSGCRGGEASMERVGLGRTRRSVGRWAAGCPGWNRRSGTGSGGTRQPRARAVRSCSSYPGGLRRWVRSCGCCARPAPTRSSRPICSQVRSRGPRGADGLGDPGRQGPEVARNHRGG